MKYKCFDCKEEYFKYQMNELEKESIQNYNWFICSECINIEMKGGLKE